MGPATKTDQVIQALVALINEPEPDHPLRGDLAEEYSKDKKKFFKNAEEFTKKHGETSLRLVQLHLSSTRLHSSASLLLYYILSDFRVALCTTTFFLSRTPPLVSGVEWPNEHCFIC